jgi:sulfatase modifying factor 1
MHKDNVVWLDGGKSHVGTNTPEIKEDGEYPPYKVIIKPFGLSKIAVTNEMFASFVGATNHKTDAETIGWSYVFLGQMGLPNDTRPSELSWWNAVEAVNWTCPQGVGSSYKDMLNHPVVHVTHRDAKAYARWADARLPNEAEWEFAARGDQPKARYPWGDDEPDDEFGIYCNIWQGQFPNINTVKDGHYGTAPVDSFEPNDYGLYNLSGNVWEWCDERYRVRRVSKSAKQRNAEASTNDDRVLKGGSFLCHKSYCWRYRIAARSGRSSDTSTSNIGFRVAYDSRS